MGFKYSSRRTLQSPVPCVLEYNQLDLPPSHVSDLDIQLSGLARSPYTVSLSELTDFI